MLTRVCFMKENIRNYSWNCKAVVCLNFEEFRNIEKKEFCPMWTVNETGGKNSGKRCEVSTQSSLIELPNLISRSLEPKTSDRTAGRARHSQQIESAILLFAARIKVPSLLFPSLPRINAVAGL